jgi:Fur family ferric uptake transcriptional regulator
VTESSQAPPLEFDAVDDVLALMRASGHRVSTACRIVLDALFASDGPVSAQLIADGLRDRADRLEPATIYRNLERLEALGVVKHVHLGHGPGLYMLVGAGEREFLACERCGRVEALEPAQLDPVRAEIRERFGYEARFGHFPIVGLCARCAAAGRRGKGR